MKDYLPHELFLNLANFLFDRYKQIDYSKLTGNIMKALYDEEVIDEVGCIFKLT